MDAILVHFVLTAVKMFKVHWTVLVSMLQSPVDFCSGDIRAEF